VELDAVGQTAQATSPASSAIRTPPATAR